MGGNGFFALVRQDIAGGVIGAAIVYFVLGLLLLTFGHLAALRARWRLTKLTSELRSCATGLFTPLACCWWWRSPPSSCRAANVRLAQLLGLIMKALSGAIFLILGLLMGLISLLFGGDEEAVEEPAPPPREIGQPFVEQAPTPEAPPWLGGTVFWIIVALLLGYATYIYLQGRGVNFQLLLAWLRQLLRGWKQIGSAFNEWRLRTLPPPEEEKGGRGRSRVRRG